MEGVKRTNVVLVRNPCKNKRVGEEE